MKEHPYWNMRNKTGDALDAARWERNRLELHTERVNFEDADYETERANAVVQCAALDAAIAHLAEAYELIDALRIQEGEPDTVPLSVYYGTAE